MTRLGLVHLKVPTAWRRLDDNATRSQKPDLARLASDERVVALQALNTHEARHPGVLDAGGPEDLLMVDAVRVHHARRQLHLEVGLLRAVADAGHVPGLQQRLLVDLLVELLALDRLTTCPLVSAKSVMSTCVGHQAYLVVLQG